MRNDFYSKSDRLLSSPDVNEWTGLTDFGRSLRLIKMGRILGIDYGEARSGLAMSDPSQIVATPLSAWEAKAGIPLLDHLRKLVAEEEIEEILLGLPRNMDGSMGGMAEAVLKLKEELAQSLGLPVSLWDERLTTVSAKRFVKENKMRTKKNKTALDTISAVLILQNYLDSKR